MKAGRFFRLSQKDFIKLPPNSEIFMLPQRAPVGYDPSAKKFIKLENYFAIAVFVPPGYTTTYNSAYSETGKTGILPLFSYAAAWVYQGGFYAACVKVDNRLCHDARFIDIGAVKKNAAEFKKIFPKNRLVRHLETCALVYNCPNAKNFFLKRCEAPLPASPLCNAMCAGCISYQPKKMIKQTQPRIKFIPTPQEISEIALFHLENVKDAVVSFGQGCEGEPLLVGDTIEESIKLIRKQTKKGIININTNASRPDALARLFDAGLDSARVSLNSVREIYYKRYYKPKNYRFSDVLRSVKIAKKKCGFVSINYLVMPGFTDSLGEFAALKRFIEKYHIDMIQWRNLNYDPLGYFRELKFTADQSKMLGVKEIIISLGREFPGLLMGYFNPTRSMINKQLHGGVR